MGSEVSENSGTVCTALLPACGLLRIKAAVVKVGCFKRQYPSYSALVDDLLCTLYLYEVPVTAPGIVLYVIALTVAPAFIEEIIFRGIVMQSLRRFGDIFALAASALIFGIFHLNLIQMPYAFILGLCIGYLVMRSGSLWVGILIHFVNNSVAVVFEFLYPNMTEEAWFMANSVYNLVCVILSVIAIAVLLMKYKDMFRFEPSKSVLAPGKRTAYFLTSPALILAMLAAVAMTLPYIYLL
ncbi:MAG: CPBP family intramembrane metalloprotease [Oscillospiraceae bacterium]|nr:CPBP family intramembrane metalloprotease [Oscillospiraceae bacterium]